MTVVPLSLRWDGDFVARIDAARGPISRSRFIREAVEEVLPAEEFDPDPASQIEPGIAGPIWPAWDGETA